MPGLVLAEGVVAVTADAKGVPSAIAKDIQGNDGEVRSAGAGIGKSLFGSIIGAFAALGIASKVGEFFGGAISGASDLNETLNKSSVIFGAQEGMIEKWGSTAATTVGLSKEAAISAAAGFGDLFTQIGFSGDAAATMSKSVVQAAADLGSFSNLDTADVADRITAAFRGEYDSLQAVIPNISAARVEQEAMAATGKTNATALTAQEKATAVLAIVQKDGSRAMGDFARTSGGAANQQKIATAAMEDQQQKLGGLLLPAWTGFLGFLTTTAIPAFSTLVTWITKNGDTIGLLAGTVAAAALAWGIYSAAVAASAAFHTAAAAAEGGMTVAQWALNAAMSANPIGIIIIAIAALVAGIIWVATQTTFFQDVWASTMAVIGAVVNWLWTSVISPVFTAIGAVFSWIYNVIILPIVTGIMLYIGLWAAVFTWLWETVLSPVFGLIGAGFNAIWSSTIQPVIGFIQNAITGAGIVFQWLYSNVIGPVFANVSNAFRVIWGSTISPIIGFISNAITTVGNTTRTVFGAIGGFISGAFQSALGVIRGPINGIIGLVNGAIRGINSLHVTIPAWVPIVGGQTWGLNIPTIPMLARGSANSPDTFIAGENGPELIVGRPGSRVYPANETRDMLGGGGGDTINNDITINEAEDPLGSGDRVARELKKWRKR